MFLKTYSTESNNIAITFTDQNGRLLEQEVQISLTFLINKQKLHHILQQQEQTNTI